MNEGETIRDRAEAFRRRYAAVREQIGRVILGHDEVVHGVLACLFVGGHCLLEGVPGLGKTLLVRTLAQTLDLDFNRIQFTPDLMPSDFVGTNLVVENEDGRRHFQFECGPIFANLVLAYEINRATPKTQSAMVEAMQEHKITVPATHLNRCPLGSPDVNTLMPFPLIIFKTITQPTFHRPYEIHRLISCLWPLFLPFHLLCGHIIEDDLNL